MRRAGELLRIHRILRLRYEKSKLLRAVGQVRPDVVPAARVLLRRRKTGRQKTDEEYVAALAELCGEAVPHRVIVDPSAASFIEALSRAGFRVEKAENDVLRGIRLTASLLKSGRIRICRGCNDTVREFYQYRWDERAGKEAPLKQNDHAMDDIRYFAAGISKLTQSLGAAWVER